METLVILALGRGRGSGTRFVVANETDGQPVTASMAVVLIIARSLLAW